MTDPMKKGWPDPLPNPFTLFGAAAPATAPPNPAMPLAQGLASGIELFNKFWGRLPGGTALPGFLVPTVDLAELDKRIADLRAAESWLDVNVNLLRATIQGLEVQRHTIAAIQSISAMADPSKGAASPAASAAPTAWPSPMASPAAPTRPSATSPAEPTPPVASPTPAGSEAPVNAAPPAAADPDGGATLVGAAATNWLGFMQDQFAKVAQAALAPSSAAAGASTKVAARKSAAPPRPAKSTARKTTTRKSGTR